MTYNGHLYGLPYYADTWAFMYNARTLQKAGFSAPPRTWDELTHQAQTIRKKGLSDHPLILLFAQTDPETQNLAELNGSGTSRLSGQFRVGLMPNTRQTVGYVRFYAMTSQLPPRGKDALAAGWDFLNDFGGRMHGRYPVVERWAVENGLAFGERSLWNNAAIDRAFSKWGNVPILRKNQEQSPVCVPGRSLVTLPDLRRWQVRTTHRPHPGTP